MNTQTIETANQVERITVSFLDTNGSPSDNNCILGLPKLEPINIVASGYNRKITLIASCLISVKNNGNILDCENMTLRQKMIIVNGWSYAQMSDVFQELPKLLANHYLKAETNGN